MNPFALAGKFLGNPMIKQAFDQGARGGIGYGVSELAKDPVNKFAGFMFGLPYATLPATMVMALNAGATAPGTLDEARRLGLYNEGPYAMPTFK